MVKKKVSKVFSLDILISLLLLVQSQDPSEASASNMKSAFNILFSHAAEKMKEKFQNKPSPLLKGMLKEELERFKIYKERKEKIHKQLFSCPGLLLKQKIPFNYSEYVSAPSNEEEITRDTLRVYLLAHAVCREGEIKLENVLSEFSEKAAIELKHAGDLGPKTTSVPKENIGDK